jgi:hypothetical protein
MTSETRPREPAPVAPILLFLTLRPAGENLTIFASDQVVADEMEVWIAREEPNEVFDGNGRRLAFEFRNDTAHEYLGGMVKVGGMERAFVRLAEEGAVTSEPTALALLHAWLTSRTGSTDDATSVGELISRCVEAGAPVRE